MECGNLPLDKEEIASPIKLARNDRVFGILLTITLIAKMGFWDAIWDVSGSRHRYAVSETIKLISKDVKDVHFQHFSRALHGTHEYGFSHC